jgi:hypothetical protein
VRKRPSGQRRRGANARPAARVILVLLAEDEELLAPSVTSSLSRSMPANALNAVAVPARHREQSQLPAYRNSSGTLYCIAPHSHSTTELGRVVLGRSGDLSSLRVDVTLALIRRGGAGGFGAVFTGTLPIRRCAKERLLSAGIAYPIVIRTVTSEDAMTADWARACPTTSWRRSRAGSSTRFSTGSHSTSRRSRRRLSSGGRASPPGGAGSRVF